MAVFAVGPGIPHKKVLLGFSPFEDAGDLSANQHAVYLDELLRYYDRDLSDIIYFVADNCSVNKKFSDDQNIPLLGCNSHRLNLAVKRYLGFNHDDGDTDDDRTPAQVERRFIIDNLGKLMVKLKTIKGKAKLQEYTDFVALKPHAIRWSGYYRIVTRFLEFKDDLARFVEDEDESGDLQDSIAELMPSTSEVLKIKRLGAALTDFQSVSLELQRKDGMVNLLDVRIMFDKLIDDYGDDMEYYLAVEDAGIIHSPTLETAIVKQLQGSSLLTESETHQLRKFELVEEEDEAEENDGDHSNVIGVGRGRSYARDILKSHRKRQRGSKTYIDLGKVPVTSNIVERFFSEVKLNMTTLRNRLLPSNLETAMYLKMNKDLCSSMTVQ